MEDIPAFGLPELYKETGFKQDDGNPGFSIIKSGEVGDALNSGNPFRNVNYGLGLFSSGEAELSIDFKLHAVRPKMAFVTSPGQVFRSVSEITDAYGILFTRDFLAGQKSEQWLKSLAMFHRFYDRPLIQLSDEEHAELLDDFQKIWLEYHSDKAMKYDALESLLILILIKLARLYEADQEIDRGSNKHHILKLESLINQQFKENRKVSNYADQMCMTPQHLNRITQKATGKSVSDLIHEKLIIELKRYLVYTDMSSEEIAHHFNFHDNSYFTKAFKKAVGETPKAFRDRQRML